MCRYQEDCTKAIYVLLRACLGCAGAYLLLKPRIVSLTTEKRAFEVYSGLTLSFIARWTDAWGLKTAHASKLAYQYSPITRGQLVLLVYEAKRAKRNLSACQELLLALSQMRSLEITLYRLSLKLAGTLGHLAELYNRTDPL